MFYRLLTTPLGSRVPRTGYGAHADYMFGWKGDSLQRAIDARCDYPDDCSSELTLQDYATANACVEAKAVVEGEGLYECESRLVSFQRTDHADNHT